MKCDGSQAAAYAAVEKIHFDGAQFRRDIAALLSPFCLAF
jgi:phosphoribosylamine-glycine ligase